MTARRDFLKQATAAFTLAAAGSARALGANDRLTVAVIGCGGMGTSHARTLAARKDVAIAAVCDPDRTRAEAAAAAVDKAGGGKPAAVQDLRRVLDDKAIQAVWVATADHWHAPAAILAVEAGKHVYVEKPCSHNIREGRLMLDAARRHNKVMQVGTQRRSSDFNRKGIELVRSGAIGEVLVAKVWNTQLRRNIGRAKPAQPPAHLDFDLWVGPAPMRPYQPNLHPYNWHWFHDFGTGDLGNDGVHQVDIALWGLGVQTHPTRVAGMGAKLFFDDDQEFPDTQYAVFEFEGRQQLVYEMRIWSPYPQEGEENGNAFYGTKGMLLLRRGSYELYDARNQLVESGKGGISLPPHHTDFLECIKSGGRPAADIEVGHRAATVVHLGNIAARVGRHLRFDPVKEEIVGDDEANRLVRRAYRDGHWAVPKGV